MPVPKNKQKLYGKVVGHMQNLEKSFEESKNIADKAIETPKVSSKKLSKSRSNQSTERTRNEVQKATRNKSA